MTLWMVEIPPMKTFLILDKRCLLIYLIEDLFIDWFELSSVYSNGFFLYANPR